VDICGEHTYLFVKPEEIKGKHIIFDTRLREHRFNIVLFKTGGAEPPPYKTLIDPSARLRLGRDDRGGTANHWCFFFVAFCLSGPDHLLFPIYPVRWRLRLSHGVNYLLFFNFLCVLGELCGQKNLWTSILFTGYNHSL